MNTPQAPAAPDPVATAAAQSRANKETAVTQYGLAATNQNTPQGSLSYRQIGTWDDGTPRYESTQTLSPGEQRIYDTNLQTRQNIGQIGQDQSARIGQLLGTPFQFSGLPDAVTNVSGGPIHGGPIANSIEGAGEIQNRIADAGGIQRSLGPTDYSADRTKVEDAIYSRLNPQLDRDTAALETKLINKGLNPGSEAWTQAIDADNRARNDARTQAVLAGGQEQSRLAGLDLQAGNFANQAQAQKYAQNATDATFANQAQSQTYGQNASDATFANQAQAQGYGQSANTQQQLFNQALTNANLSNAQRAALVQEQLTMRNQPINEISALMSGSQVSNPTFGSTPTPGVAPTDVIGAQQQSLNQQNLQYQGGLQSHQGLMSGLFGLGSAGLGGWMRSDINAKENIDVVGQRPDGLHVIDYDYKPEEGLGSDRHRGLVAQEVERVYPQAVARGPDGKRSVNYAAVPGGLFLLGEVARRAA